METKIIGSKIAEARKKTSISQAQLAERLFISPQAVGKWERGESMPDIITLNRLAEIVGVDLNYFSESFLPIDMEAVVTETKPTDSLTKARTGSPSGEQKKKSSWDMSNENLADTDFSGLKNLHEKFSSSNIQRCQFVGSNMSGLILKSNNIDSCDFSDSDISNSQIQNSNLANTIFKNCSLKETVFLKSAIDGCNLSGSDLTNAGFKSAGFGNNKITNVLWNHTSFADTYIADILFEGTLEDCFFENCAFTKVTFQNSILINTFFKNNKRLNKIEFINCKADKITYAFLKNGKADVSGITLLTE